jgi:ABC-type branched-subunit amino acid transport system ATPase component/branched-subunit amino acid ABC-type transport system permease component
VEFVPYIISGLVTGSVYGLAGTGLVLTYKTSAVFNFAHGALATLSAFIFYTLFVTHGVPWPVAVLLCLAVVAPAIGVLLERVARRLTGTSLAVRVACTVGILLVIQAGIVLTYGTTNDKTFPHFLPQNGFHIGSTPVTAEDLIVVFVAVAATAFLYAFFRISRLGVAMRAVVDNPDLLDLAGTPPRAVRRWAWVIGSIFAMASGLLIGPKLTPLNATTMTLLVITAFGAAAIGAFTSLPMTYVGGLGIGLVQALCTKYLTGGFWSGLAPSLPFLALFAVLLVAPKRRMVDRSLLIPRQRSTWTAPPRVQAAGAVPVLAILCFVPAFAGLHLDDWATALSTTILFLSLGLLVRTSGQVSLCHVSFLAIGSCAMAHLTAVDHVPWLVALVLSGLIAVPVGAVLSIPAIRLSGLYLALATFGFGLLLQDMFYSQSYMFGGFGVPISVPRPHLSWLSIASDRGYYFLLLGLTIVAAGLVITINRSRLGRLLRGLADSPTALATSGTGVNTTRVLVFCISAFLAAGAGALQAGVQPVSAGQFQPLVSLTFFALIIITVGGEPWYALIAGLGFTLIPSYVGSPKTANWLELLFGLGAVAYALTPDERRGVPGAVRRVLDRFATATPMAAPPTAVPAASTSASRPLQVTPFRREPVAAELRVEKLMVSFGGLVAVDGVSLHAPTGRITGLIGPNGAGKTTIFNACSGLVRPSGGSVHLSGTDITRSPVARRARAGLGRTFQHFELFDSLSVRQNVALGAEGAFAGANPLGHMLATPVQQKEVKSATEAALDSCELRAISDSTVGSLSTGQRRLVELARCLAGDFRLLLLDEPSSGLDSAETVRFGRMLRAAVEERGIGVLLVEHDMSLVTEFCDYLYVVDFGRLVFEGTPGEAVASPVVQAAYLGSPELEEVPA